MAGTRKDKQGYVLWKGEYQRSSDNMYVYAYRDAGGKRHVIYANTLVELREKEKGLTMDSLQGIDSYVAGKATLNMLFDRYMSTKTSLRVTTKTNYLYMYDRFVRDDIGNWKISKVRYSDVLKYYLRLIGEGKSLHMVEDIHRLISPAFDMAVRDDVLRKNPCNGVMKELKDKTGKKRGSTRYALTEDQEKAFLSYVRNSPVYEKWYPLFLFLFGTGCRIGEAIGIRWEDIDFENDRIDINHSMSYTPIHDKGYACEFVVHPPKTANGVRQIPILPIVRDVLIAERERQEKEGFCTIEVGGLTGFVFTNRFGSVHHPTTVNKAIKRIYTSYNMEEVVDAKKERREPLLIPHFSCHQMRHTYCTRLCEVETNLKVIQSIMGHADIRTTMEIYAEATDSGIDKAMENLSVKANFLID